MNFQVFWHQQAEEELARLWLEKDLRDPITNAAKTIDSLLKSNPTDVGESRAVGRRILYVSPLGVIYRVLPEDMRVRVLRVWYHARKGDA